MIDRELRKGNLIHDEFGNLFEVQALGLLSARIRRVKDTGKVRPYGKTTPYEFIKPIPLTEDWVRKFGFEELAMHHHFNKWWGENGIEFLRWDEDSKKVLFDLGYHFRQHRYKVIDYVHSFQNFWKELTSEELTYKP